MRHLLLGCLFLAVVTSTEGKSYRGHTVLSAKASTEEQLTVLQNLENSHDLVFLREPSMVLSTDFVVPPEQKEQLLETLRDADITVTVLSSDLQAEIDAEKTETFLHRREHQHTLDKPDMFNHTFYRDLDQVNKFMTDIETHFPQLVRKREMNWRTHENRPVYVLEIGTRDSNKKPVIFIEALTHAREWIATASLLYSISEMLQNCTKPDVNAVLSMFTWIIVPVVNPDGYVYTWAYDRMWRKNRRYIPNLFWPCYGVDLNRNYDAQWGKVGVSFDCNRDTFLGEAPFSEPETQNIRDLFLELKERIVSFLSVHAYSQVLLHPWGFSASNNMPTNFEKLEKMGQKMLNALSLEGKTYGFGTPYSTLGYAASGGSYDWALVEKRGIYSYCYELRPSSWDEGGFVLPPHQIKPTGNELLNSLLILAQALLNMDE